MQNHASLNSLFLPDSRESRIGCNSHTLRKEKIKTIWKFEIQSGLSGNEKKQIDISATERSSVKAATPGKKSIQPIPSRESFDCISVINTKMTIPGRSSDSEAL